ALYARGRCGFACRGRCRRRSHRRADGRTAARCLGCAACHGGGESVAEHPDCLDELEVVIRKLLGEHGEAARDKQGNLIEGEKQLPAEYWDCALSIRMLREAID